MKSKTKAKREAKQLFHLCLEKGRPDTALIRKVTQQIANSSRRGAHAILKQFERLVRLWEAQRTAVIESAMLLPTDLQGTLEESLTRRYGPGLTTMFTHRPALIAGMRIQVGCDVYDGSVRARLAALEKSF
jgi:F-type H+-transporting ATPase subunit delta